MLPSLVARDHELAVLVAAMRATPALASVEGEAGVGKTRLVTELARLAEGDGRRTLRGVCLPIRESFPLGPLVEAVRGVGAVLADLRLSPVAGALVALMPELAPWLPPAPEPLDDRRAERHRVFRGLVEVLAGLSPALLVLEDLHWVDEHTRDFVSYLISVAPPELALVLTYRGEAAASVRAVTARLPVDVSGTHLVLAPLTPEQTGVLIAAILGIDKVSAEFARFMWERTAGLPYAVEELLAVMRARGHLVRRGGEWERKQLAQLEVPRAIRDSTLERWAGLPPDARRVAEAAAVLQVPSPVPVLSRMTDGPADIGAVEAAIASGLLVEDADAIGFRHMLAAQAVYENISRLRRQDLHSRAAAALRATDAPPLGRVAHHLKHAGQPGEWALAVEQAAAQAVGLGHDEEAARLLADVLRHVTLEPEQHGRIVVQLGRAALETLHASEFTDLLAGAIDEPGLVRTVRGELRFLLAIALGQAGADVPVQRGLLTAAVEDLDGRPDLRAWAMVALSIPGIDPSGHQTWLLRSLDVIAEVDDPLLEVFLLGKVGGVLVGFGDPRWRSTVDRVLALTGGMPRQRREVNAHWSLGLSAGYSGHLELSGRLLAGALSAPATRENPRLAAMVRSALAVQRFCRGDWTGLGDEVEQLTEELSDYAQSRMDIDLVAGALALARGEVADAEPLLRGVFEQALETGAHELLPLAGAWCARAGLARDDAGAALVVVRGVVAELDAKHVWGAPSVWAIPAAVDALVAAGEPDEAYLLLQRAGAALADHDAPLLRAALSYGRGALLAAPDEFEAAAAAYRTGQASYEAARATERAAGCLFGSDEGRAAALLREAAATYERLGAVADHDRAAGLGRRYGITLGPRHRGGRRGHGAELTPRERQVAVLAAAGETNKAIAQALFVSANTVEKHMAAVLRKLRARSRVQLADLLGPAADDGGDRPLKDGGFRNS